MRVLFVGLGGVGQRHLRNLLDIDPNINISAVRKIKRNFEIGNDVTPDYTTGISKKYNITIYSSIADAMKFKPDFAVVANPTRYHVSTALDLVSEGIPVFLEKPISDNYDGLGDLLRISRDKDVIVMTGYMMRFNPGALKVKELIDNQRIGRIYSVVLIVNSYMPSWHCYEKYNEFYAGMKSLGGGVILTEIHEVDLLNWYFGTPKRLWAVGGKLSPLDLDVEDSVSIMFDQEYNGNCFPVSLIMSFVQKSPLRKMLIQGEHGSIEWDIAISKVFIEDKSNNQSEVFDYSDFQRNKMFIAEISHFIDCLREGKEPITSIHKVIGGHYTALAMKESLMKGDIIRPHGPTEDL